MTDVDRVARDLSPGGALASALPGYEARDEQVTMARAVARTLEAGGVLVVEAGTGTGKSLAYLVPAIHWVKRNGERVILSTRTITLQEQLVKTDIPFLLRHLGVEFTAALVKGRNNYLCLRKANELRLQPSLLGEADPREIPAILEWSEHTRDGSLADLGFLPSADAWEAVRVEHDDCLRTRCPEYEQCFFYKARRAASSADLLIVNHSLLMADQALRAELSGDEASGILPAATRLVIDEAHHLEDVSTDYFGGRITLRRIERVLGRLQPQRRPGRGILSLLLDRLSGITDAADRPAAEGASRWITERLRPRSAELVREAARAFDSLAASARGPLRDAAPAAAGSEESTLRVVPALRETAFWADARIVAGGLADQLDAFAGETRPVLERLDGLSEAAAERVLFPATQLRAMATRLGTIALELREFLADDEASCRWLSLRPERDRSVALAFCSAPVEIGPQLRSSLFTTFEAVVLTSATLTVEKRFDYFLERTGMAALPRDSVDSLRLASPFRFEDQALVAVPEDVPEPDRPGYEEALHGAIDTTVTASGGGAFVLFTSYGALEKAHAKLGARFRSRGLDVMRQGEADRQALLSRFRRSRKAVLFATDSFWEGVDVRGEGLRAVIIAKLPFRVPTEPIQQARMEAIEARGGNPFGDYGLPQAVIRLRQGFGRLIRSREDTGVVVIVDSRIARRRYGEVFLGSLPPAPVIVGPSEVVFSEVTKFLGGGGG